MTNDPTKLSYSKKAVEITPDLAREWIDKKNERNYRPPSEKKAKDFAKLMGEGKWCEEHPDGIQFDWYGNLGNGQHRLIAIILSGRTLRMMVETGIDPKHFEFTDKNKPRTTADDLAFAGFRSDMDLRRACAIASRMIMGINTQKPDSDTTRDLALLHEDLITEIYGVVKAAKPWRAEIAAAFCKATFEWPKEKVISSARRYVTQKFTGQMEDPLKKLSDKVRDFRSHGGKAHRLYACAVSAIRADMEDRTLGNLYEAGQDFVGPWEPGYIPVERRERARKGHETFLNKLKTSDRLKTAKDALDRARSAGMQFTVTPDMGEVKWVVPAKFSPTILKTIKTLIPEVTTILLEERALEEAIMSDAGEEKTLMASVSASK